MSQEEGVAMIKMMFAHIPDKVIRRTLAQAHGDTEQAVDLLLSMGDSFDTPADDDEECVKQTGSAQADGTDPSSAQEPLSLLLPKTDRTRGFQDALRLALSQASDQQFLEAYDESLLATLLPLLDSAPSTS